MDGVEVVIEDTAGCPRYIAAVLRGVKVGPSPGWLQARLRGVGARPINNVVDATNYILYELNQPLHAFDLAKLRGRKIIVRRAQSGERITTLDGETRELTAEMTMICDAEGPVAIAGLMGGADSEVSGETTDILLECAYFDPKRIRSTRKALRMGTEASYRFERGTDIQAMPDAVSRAVAVIRAVAGGTEPESPVDVYPKPVRSRIVFLRPERVEHVLGTSVSVQATERLLVSVGFVVAPKDGRLAVQVPGWRPDVTREVDLIEEVARLIGYDEFPVELRPHRPSSVPDDPVEALKAKVRRVLTAMGLHEARSLALVAAGGEHAQPIVNPMSVEEAYLREDLLTGLLRAARRNWSVREREVRLFELGVVFQRAGQGLPPVETLHLAGIVSGARSPAHWSAAGKVPDYDLWDLKDMFREAVRVCGPRGRLAEGDGGWVLEDGDGRRRGWAGTLTLDRPAWSAPLLGFEIDVVVPDEPPTAYVRLATTPPVERDVALVLPWGVSAAEVERTMRGAGGSLLEDVEVFDEYRSGQLVGRSVAWRLVFRAPSRTLEDREVDEAMDRMLRQLKEQLGVERRQA